MILAVKRNNNFLKSKKRNKHCNTSNEKPHCEEQTIQYLKDKEEMIKHKTLNMILQIEIPIGATRICRNEGQTMQRPKGQTIQRPNN